MGTPVASQLLGGARGAQHQRRIVAGVGVAQPAGRRLEDAEERRGVLLGRRAAVEQAGEAGADLLGRQAVLDRAGRERLEGDGEQRGRHPLARDVGHHQHALAPVAALDHLVVVPRDAARRDVAAVELPARRSPAGGRGGGPPGCAGPAPAPPRGGGAPPPPSPAPGCAGGGRRPRRARPAARGPPPRTGGRRPATRARSGRASPRDRAAGRRPGCGCRRGACSAAAEKRSSAWTSKTIAAIPFSATSRVRLREKVERFRAALGGAAGGRPVAPLGVGVLEQDGAAVGVEMVERPVEDQLQQRVQGERAAERLMDLVEQLEAVGVALEVRGVGGHRRALAVEQVGGAAEDRAVQELVRGLGAPGPEARGRPAPGSSCWRS